ncbi:MAG: FG-GAP repeat protein [Pseudohongiellaceae bacterium]
MPGCIEISTVYTATQANRTTNPRQGALRNPNPSGEDYFGWSVSATGQGDIVVGAWNDTVSGVNAGAVYVFNGNDGALLQTIANPNPSPDFRFGYSLATTGSGTLGVGWRGRQPVSAQLLWIFSSTRDSSFSPTRSTTALSPGCTFVSEQLTSALLSYVVDPALGVYLAENSPGNYTDFYGLNAFANVPRANKYSNPTAGPFGGKCGPEGSRKSTWIIPDLTPGACDEHVKCWLNCWKQCKGQESGCRIYCDDQFGDKNPLYLFFVVDRQSKIYEEGLKRYCDKC